MIALVAYAPLNTTHTLSCQHKFVHVYLGDVYVYVVCLCAAFIGWLLLYVSYTNTSISYMSAPLALETPLHTSRYLHSHLSFTRICGRTNAFDFGLPRAITLWNDLLDIVVSIT